MTNPSEPTATHVTEHPETESRPAPAERGTDAAPGRARGSRPVREWERRKGPAPAARHE